MVGRPLVSDDYLFVLAAAGVVEPGSPIWADNADVVAFIYRDDTYHRDSSDKGVAEIIVAKHRNGPTAKIRLAFLEHLTKFANIAR